VILAHAAVTDVDGGHFYAEERFARLAAGMAELRGGDAAPFRIACADWSAVADHGVDSGGDGFLPLRLRAGGRGFSFDLRLEPGTPPVLQGENGLSRKSDAPGNASIYYSMTRLPIDGTIRVGGVDHEVAGLAWVDREWSTSALAADQVGWDWFSLQLDNGDDLMWYRLRRRDGSVDRTSRGSLVSENGTQWVLQPTMVSAEAIGEWRAADGGARYPARWRLVGAAPRFDLEIEPLLPDQELRLSVRYWEGAVSVKGTRNGKPVTGRGYLEMTGYANGR
jgi:predicted secreted hydrolase